MARGRRCATPERPPRKRLGAWETVCPKRADRRHCVCWYDDAPCCACGDDGAPGEEITP